MKPLAYHLTWTTYGTWLPGDNRGWVESPKPGIHYPDPMRQTVAESLMVEAAVMLDDAQRVLVDATIREVCRHRGWTLHALNVRTNHVHTVITAPIPPEQVMRQLKAWCSRRLSDREGLAATGGASGRRRWWTEHGSTKWINDEEYLQNVVRYVNEGQ